jgi:hypothetical protein
MMKNPIFLNQVEMNERLIRAMVTQGGILAFVSGLNNALYHGDVFEEDACGDIVSEPQLEALYVHIDGLSKIATEIDKA